VGVGGSIAAYRACDVVRRLIDLGATVRVAPTRSAAAFVTPLTFEALSGRPCLGGVLDVDNGRIPHIEEAHRADAAVIVPASADVLARLAHGFADEALLATMLSFAGPIVIAPAMETRMWTHAATQASTALLRERGALFVGPVEGALASGRSGAGRMSPVDDVLEAVLFALTKKDLAGVRIVVTAGPTVEDIDAVRSITNRSSGRMGTALARAAALRGARVDLVHGPMKIAVPTIPLLLAHAVRSAREMFEVTTALADDADAMLLCAAVADARPATIATRKLKKSKGELRSIALVPTEDILATLGARASRRQGRPVLVGFAAETSAVAKSAREKLVRKRCDLVCANDVSALGSGFDVGTNRMILVGRGKDRVLGPASKAEIADGILDEVKALLASPPARSGWSQHAVAAGRDLSPPSPSASHPGSRGRRTQAQGARKAKKR
jgi:phosphopantothenoylcysteine decarboxylase/phosphopantothenate--cysteine ligase